MTKKISNCLFFALEKWFKFGGYLIIRKSKFGFWLHFMWSKDLKDADVEHFVPVKKPLRFPLVQKILFVGKSEKKGDDENTI